MMLSPQPNTTYMTGVLTTSSATWRPAGGPRS